MDEPTYEELTAERDRLRAVAWGETKLRASLAGARFARDEAIEERDRLRAVVAKVQRLWHERGEVQATEELDQAAFAEWRAAWDEFLALDVSGDMGGMTAEQAYDHYADPANQEPVGPPVQRKPVEQDRQRIWSAITAWEEVGYVLNADTGVPEPTDFRHKPLSPFFDELRAMVFDEEGDTDG